MNWNKKKILILNVLLIKNGNIIERTVYRKPKKSNIYLIWKSFAPGTWEQGTLKTLIKSAHLMCSNEKYLEEQLNHIKFVF